MALPHVHVAVTTPISIWSAAAYPMDTALGACNFVTVLFCGFLLDVDHVSMRRMRKLMGLEGAKVKGWREWIGIFYLFGRRVVFSLCEKQTTKDLVREPVVGWVNWMHTWWAFSGVAIFSVIIGSGLPLISYGAHVLIDGGNSDYLGHPGAAPVPEFLHRFYPSCLKYGDYIV